MNKAIGDVNGVILTLDLGSIANTTLKDVNMKIDSGLFILH
jgi:hypothetical protein